MTKADVDELLAAVDELLNEISSQYQLAVAQTNVLVISRPKIKACLEHLRAALDYVAVAINVAIYGKPASATAYFPYGNDPAKAPACVDARFRGLKAFNQAVFDALVLSQSNHGGPEPWLFRLCKLTNENKHVSLTTQSRQNLRAVSLFGGAITHMPGSSGTMVNCTFDNGGGDVGFVDFYTYDQRLDSEAVAQQLPHVDHTTWVAGVEFKINGSDWDVMQLLRQAREGVQATSDAVFAAL